MTDTSPSLRDTILDQMHQVADEQGKVLAPLADDVKLLATGLDSLCLAILVARLDDELGIDPFGTGDAVAMPVTVGDLIGVYEAHPV